MIEEFAKGLGYGLVCAAIVSVLALAFRRPRARAQQVITAIRLRLYLRRRQDTALAIARISAELADQRCRKDGNPDDELRDDWSAWFRGDPDADAAGIVHRKTGRDLARLDGHSPPGRSLPRGGTTPDDS